MIYHNSLLGLAVLITETSRNQLGPHWGEWMGLINQPSSNLVTILMWGRPKIKPIMLRYHN